jgi:hypothetical protein
VPVGSMGRSRVAACEITPGRGAARDRSRRFLYDADGKPEKRPRLSRHDHAFDRKLRRMNQPSPHDRSRRSSRKL